MTPAEAVVALAAAVYLVVVALLLGSFINLAADRLPKGESVVRPRSHCRRCRRVLGVVDLIPIAGYAIRRGRCASCGCPIGASSPAVEALSGGAMLASLVLLGPTIQGALGGFLGVTLLGVAAVWWAHARARGARGGSRVG